MGMLSYPASDGRLDPNPRASMNFSVANVASNPIPDHFNWTGPGILGGDPGVKLVVRSGIPPDGYVDLAQMDSIRTDLLWGSYRASLKLPAVKGTCSAFFWVGCLVSPCAAAANFNSVLQRQPRD